MAGFFDKPKAPDPSATANTQLGYNKDAAQSSINVNSINKSGPFGSSNFTKDASGNTTGISTSLDPTLAPSAGNITGNLGSVTGQLPTQNFDSTTAVPNTDAIGQTYFNKGKALLQPAFDQSKAQNDVNLTNRGLPIGSEARNISEGNLERSHDLALSDLAAGSNLAASNEQQRLIGNARTDYLQPYDTSSKSLGLLAGLKGLTPEATAPTASVGSPDYTGSVNNAYNQEMTQYNAKMTGLGQLAGAGAGMLAGLPPGTLTGMFNSGAKPAVGQWNTTYQKA
jgi:hypothetical protein